MTKDTIIKPNRKQRRTNLTGVKNRPILLKPDLPWYLIKALESGDVVKVHLALLRAYEAGYDDEYIAIKLGITEKELTELLDAKTL